MTPSDPRHGTTAGYIGGCRCAPCTRAIGLYEKRRQLDMLVGRTRTVPVDGARRRIQALQRLGWSARALSLELGHSPAWLHRAITPNTGVIFRSTHDLIDRVYRERCMTPGPSKLTRQRAERAGWPPPLAWSDIDAGTLAVDERPASRHDEVDPVVVDRMLGGDMTLAQVATRAEREAVLARWEAAGRSSNELERLTGWAPHRYRVRDEAA